MLKATEREHSWPTRHERLRQGPQDPRRRRGRGRLTGALATEQDLPITDYDKQTADDIASKLNGFTQRELRMIDAYERKRENRATITDKIAKLTGDEPWSGYDEQSVDAIATALDDTDALTAREVRPTSASTRTAPASSRTPRSASSAARTPRVREAQVSRALISALPSAARNASISAASSRGRSTGTSSTCCSWR